MWWENLKKQRERDSRERVRSWEKLKKLMKRRFLSDNHKQDLYLKLHTLKQGSDGAEHYIREFEKLLMRSELPEVKWCISIKTMQQHTNSIMEITVHVAQQLSVFQF